MSSIPRPLLGLFVALVFVVVAAPAQAAFPGQNGQIAFERNGQVIVSNPDGSAERVLATGGDPAWSPNGRQIAYHVESRIACGLATSMSVWEIRVINADGTGQRTVTRGNRNNCGSGAAQPTWSPDGTQLAFVDGVGGDGSNDGTSIEAGARNLFTVPLNGGSPTRLTTGLRFISRPSWSPDGTRIAFSGEQVGGGQDEIFTIPPAGGTVSRLTTNPRDDFGASWSPDSSRIVFTSERDDIHFGNCDGDAAFRCNTEIYTMNRDGTNIVRVTDRGPETKDSYAAYSPDGTQIIFISNRFGTSDTTSIFFPTGVMRVHRMTTSGQVLATLFDGINPDWQPATPAVALSARLGHFAPRDNDYSYRGDETTATFDVHLTNPAPLGGTTVTLSSDDPAHAAVPPTVTVPAGASSAPVTVALTAPTGALSVRPTLTASFAGRSVPQRIEIFPRAALSLIFLGNVRAPDNTARIDLTTPAPAGGAVVSLTSSNPTLAPVPATVTVPAGQAQLFFPLFIKSVTATSSFTVTATYNAVTKSDSATVQPDPKVVSITLNPTSVVGGAVGSGFTEATVTLDRAVPNDVPFQSAELLVALTSDDAHARPNGDVRIGPGGTTGTMLVNTDPVAGDTVAHITATSGGQSRSASLTIRSGVPIQPAQPDVSTFTLTPNTVVNGGTVQGRVTLVSPAPTGGTTVRFSQGLNNPNVARSIPDAIIPAGQSIATFPVTAAFTSPNPATGTITARTVTQTGLGAPVDAQLTVTPAPDPPPPPPASDTVRVTRAQYDAGKRELRVEATSTNASATLTAFNNTTNAQIGTLQNNGGQYRGQFTNVANPGTVRVTSSLGGSATLAVSAASGTVRPAAAGTTTASSGSLVTPAVKALLHATSVVALPAADPADRTAPKVSAVRLLPNRIRVGSRRGTLVSFTLDEPSRVTLSFARRVGKRLVPVRGGLQRTLPKGRVRVRFHGVLAAGPLASGVYRVTIDAVDASGNRAASRRAVLVLRRGVV